ncbi:hemerythrin domain-containing protein [Kocuria oceani]|uniref:hemerythrin domain-containing protein n=1 Tax=Kocuria oceani TaxID=988827 RepID=UPI0040357F50
MRSIADQSVEELGGPSSVLVRMRREHGEQEALLQRLEATSGDAQDEVLTRLWRVVFPHAYAEETVVWPAIRAVSDDGDELTLHIEQGHQKLSELTAQLERTRPGEPGREELITELVAELRLDIREEEDDLLPRLRAGADNRRLRRLGAAWTLVRHTAPTRPHVAVSRRPPGNVIAALPLSVVDRCRDGLDRAARASTGGVRAAAEAASRALAWVAGAIERSRPVQRGERSRTRPGRWTVHRWLTRDTPPTSNGPS